MSKSNGPQINWLGSAGSALGSVTSAVLLSSLGAGGTLVGAAIGSLTITVGGAIYSHVLDRGKTRLEETAEKVKFPKRSQRDSWSADDEKIITATSDREQTAQHESVDHTDDTQPAEEHSWRDRMRTLPWKRIGGLSAALFVVTMVIILVFELFTGRPVSSYTGGTSPDSTGTTFQQFTGQDDEQTPTDDGPVIDDPDVEQPDAPIEQPAPEQETEEPEPQEAPMPDAPPAPEPEAPAPPQEEAPQAPVE